MMKKISRIVLMVALIVTTFSFSGCKKEPDLEAFNAYYEANKFDSILERHKTVLMSATYYYNGEKVSGESTYLDNDQYLWKGSFDHEILCRKDLYMYVYTDGRTPDKTIIVFESAQDGARPFVSYKNQGLFNLPESETLTETIDKGGKFTAVTEDSSQEGVLNAISYVAAPENNIEYKEGMKVQYRYFIDKESAEMTGMEGYIIDPRGKAMLYMKSETTFDVARFDPDTAGPAYKDYFTKMEENDVCNFTFVFAPGTDNEHSVYYVLPHGGSFSAWYNNGYANAYYTDRECTKEYVYNGPETELTLYVK